MTSERSPQHEHANNSHNSFSVSPPPSLPAFPSLSPSLSTPPLHFHPPTSAPHLFLHPDHLTASHSGPGHHSQDHTILHTNLPITFPCRDDVDDEDDDVHIAYFEVRIGDGGKKGELFVGLLSADSPAVDPQLLAQLKTGDTTAQLAAERLHDPALTPLTAPASAPSLVYSSSNQRQLGCEHPQSLAIQLNTGRLFSVQLAKGIPFLPAFSSGDTIGVGFVYGALSTNASSTACSSSPATHQSSLFAPSLLSSTSSSAFSAPSIPASSLTLSSYLFFTKNGKLLGDKEVNMDHAHLTPASLSSLSSLYFPAISFHSPNESITANFGQSPFLFDLPALTSDMREREGRIRREVEYEKGMMLGMVKEYLVWHGYDGTLKVLEESEGGEDGDVRVKWTGGAPSKGKREGMVLRASVELRSRVRQLIQASKVDDAIALLQQHYPSVLRRPSIRFLLHALHFIAILTSPHSSSSTSRPLLALQYARRNLLQPNATADETALLPRLMGLLALRESEWEGNPLMGSEWREEVADHVNDEMVRMEHRRASQHSDIKEPDKRSTKEQLKGDGGMDVEEDDKEDDEDKEDEDDEEITGSAVELLIAQLLAVDTVWRQQRPLLPHPPTPPADAEERARWWLDQQ